MARINNREVLKRIEQDAFIQAGVEQVPNRLSNTVVPVLNCNPLIYCNVAEGYAHDAASTIYTTSSKKVTYLIAAQIGVTKDGANASAATSLRIVVGGKDLNPLRLVYEPSTAGSFHTALSFNVPIKLDKGSTVQILNTNNAASIDTHGSIIYYEVDQE